MDCVMFLYQVVHNFCFSFFFLMLAVIDAHCPYLLVYLRLQNREIPFHLLIGILCEEKLPCIYCLIIQWSSVQHYS